MCSHHLLFLFLKVICQLCYPFGETEGDLIVPVQDDGSSLPVLLNQPFPFYASNETTLFVSSPKIAIPLFLRKVIVYAAIIFYLRMFCFNALYLYYKISGVCVRVRVGWM